MMRRLTLLLMAGAFGLLFGSQCQSVQGVRYHLSKAGASYPLDYYWLAASLGVEQAIPLLRAKAIDANEPYWLDMLMYTDSGETAWQRYLSAPNDSQARRYLKVAADNGLPQAQYRYALLLNHPQKKEQWLTLAAQNQVQDAQIALADWYLLQGDVERAKPWLELASINDQTSQVALAKILWAEGERERSQALFSKAAESGSNSARERLSITRRYQPVTDNLPPIQFAQECTQKLLVLADSLESMVNAVNITKAFIDDERLSALDICLSEPVWLESQLTCSDDYANSGRLGCELLPFADWVEEGEASHLIVVGQRGKANVQNGVMFIDSLDSYSVFVHELAHFAGFVDEYELSFGAANAYCGFISATNLVFERDNGFMLDLAPQAQLQLWQSLDAFGGGLYPAATCGNSDIQAFKPTAQATFLQHHESAFIPAIYLELWGQVVKAQQEYRPVLRYLAQLQSD